jgi:hypothetical protein
MNTINLTCNCCGAPLEAPDGTNFITCRFCSTRLAIEYSESAVYTRVLEAIQNQTFELSQDLGTIKLQNDLERLDREWQMEREHLLERGTSGQLYEPSVGVASWRGGFHIVIGLIWFAVAVSASLATGYVLLGLVSLIGLGLAMFGFAVFQYGTRKARHFQNIKADYEDRRSTLTQELNSRAS